jgi:amino acid permease
MAAANPQELSRSLQGRHLTMISIGGIIGAGLFVSSSTSIIAGRSRLLHQLRDHGTSSFCS